MKPLALRLPTPRMLLFLILVLALSAPGCRSNDAPRGRALRVGVTPGFAPAVFEQDGEIVGIEADLARALGERLGRRVVFERFAEGELLGALEAGEVDVVMSGLSITPERARRVLFATPYMESGQLALIRAHEIAAVHRPLAQW